MMRDVNLIDKNLMDGIKNFIANKKLPNLQFPGCPNCNAIIAVHHSSLLISQLHNWIYSPIASVQSHVFRPLMLRNSAFSFAICLILSPIIDDGAITSTASRFFCVQFHFKTRRPLTCPIAGPNAHTDFFKDKHTRLILKGWTFELDPTAIQTIILLVNSISIPIFHRLPPHSLTMLALQKLIAGTKIDNTLNGVLFPQNNNRAYVQLEDVYSTVVFDSTDEKEGKEPVGFGLIHRYSPNQVANCFIHFIRPFYSIKGVLRVGDNVHEIRVLLCKCGAGKE